MSIKIAERIAAQCSVVYRNNYDTVGTITRASIDYLTPSQLESLFTTGGLFADLDAWFRTAFEMKACGTKVNGMYDFIMSGADRTRGRSMIQTEKSAKNPAVVWPFILGLQDSVVNTEYWAITTGGAQSGYTAETTGPLTASDLAEGQASDRWVRIVSRHGVELDEKWFVPRATLHIISRSGIGVAQHGQWRVLASAHNEARTSADVLLRSENGGSSQPYATAPTSGVVLIGVNNVNDYEKLCNNRANWDGRKQVPFWWQTMRRSRRVDEQYREYFKRLTTSGVNEAFARFGDLTLAERNAQDEFNHQREFVNAFFFNKPISENQTTSLYKSLEQIPTPSGFGVDPGLGGKLISYRANFVGVREQLRQCDRYRDLQGNTINFYEFLDENYRIMRARKSQGKNVKAIDWFTDSVTAANFISAYTQYLKNEYGSTNVQFPIDITKTMSNDLGFAWRTMLVKYPAGIEINIVTHEFFDDYRDANKTESQETMGSLLLALEFGKDGAHWSQLATNRKSWTVGDINKLAPIDRDWACVMESITEEVTHVSESGAVVVPCPANMLWIENFADAIPVTTGKTANPSYTDLY